MRGLGLGKTAIRALLSAAVMGGVVYAAMLGIQHQSLLEGRAEWALTVLVSGTLGLITYLLVGLVLRVPEIKTVLRLLGRIAGPLLSAGRSRRAD
jgi:hypothetical protein